MNLVVLLSILVVIGSVAARITVLTNPFVRLLRAGAWQPDDSSETDQLSAASERKIGLLKRCKGVDEAQDGGGLSDKPSKEEEADMFITMLLETIWCKHDHEQPEIFKESLKSYIPDCKYVSIESAVDPYHMMLHMLWGQMCEKNWRTVAKSLHILHTIARDCGESECRKFGAAFKNMTTTQDPRKPEHRYFEVDKIAELNKAGAEHEPFVHAYATYVTARTQTYTARFEELKGADEQNSSEMKVLAAMMEAHELICLGDLLDEYANKVALFVSKGKYASTPHSTNTTTNTTTNANTAEVSVAVAEALYYYLDSRERVDFYLSRCARMYARHGITISTDPPLYRREWSGGPYFDDVIDRIAQHGGPPDSVYWDRPKRVRRALHHDIDDEKREYGDRDPREKDCREGGWRETLTIRILDKQAAQRASQKP